MARCLLLVAARLDFMDYPVGRRTLRAPEVRAALGPLSPDDADTCIIGVMLRSDKSATFVPRAGG